MNPWPSPLTRNAASSGVNGSAHGAASCSPTPAMLTLTITCRWAMPTNQVAGIGTGNGNAPTPTIWPILQASQVTDASVNRSKGKQPPDEWRPGLQAGWCRYAADWIMVKKRWELTVTAAEVNALGEMLATCDDPGSWGLRGVQSQ